MRQQKLLKNIGKTVAKNFLKHFDKVSAALKPLLKWADIPAQAVYDAVTEHYIMLAFLVLLQLTLH